MDDKTTKKESIEEPEQPGLISKAIRAGKRTYFLDVKSTRKNDFFLTITESKKRYNKDGRFYYEKHKIFLYQEDFEKFSREFSEVLQQVNNLKPTAPENFTDDDSIEEISDYTSVEFDDLQGMVTGKHQDEK